MHWRNTAAFERTLFPLHLSYPQPPGAFRPRERTFVFQCVFMAAIVRLSYLKLLDSSGTHLAGLRVWALSHERTRDAWRPNCRIDRRASRLAMHPFRKQDWNVLSFTESRIAVLLIWCSREGQPSVDQTQTRWNYQVKLWQWWKHIPFWQITITLEMSSDHLNDVWKYNGIGFIRQAINKRLKCIKHNMQYCSQIIWFSNLTNIQINMFNVGFGFYVKCAICCFHHKVLQIQTVNRKIYPCTAAL